MTTETIIANTKQMIDDLKTVCANFGLGNASSEYKIITEIFLYKFLNDKFLYEVQQAEESLKDSDNVEQRQMAKGENNLRPHLIHFNRCRNILLEDFHIRQSLFWILVF